MCVGNLATDAINQAGMPIPAVAAWGLPSGSINAATITDNSLRIEYLLHKTARIVQCQID